MAKGILENAFRKSMAKGILEKAFKKSIHCLRAAAVWLMLSG
jgi:hypothetical protein